MVTHARQLDRRRLALVLHDGDGEADAVLAALDAYRNTDGGYGWGLEPDLRSAESQPTAAMHAFEVLGEIAPRTSPHVIALCDWLRERTLPDGGLPFTLPVRDPSGCAPWWLGADPRTSSLQMTTQVAAKAHVVARHDRRVADHPWLATATRWCLDAIRAIETTPHAYELLFALQFLDAVHDVERVRLGAMRGRTASQVHEERESVADLGECEAADVALGADDPRGRDGADVLALGG